MRVLKKLRILLIVGLIVFVLYMIAQFPEANGGDIRVEITDHKKIINDLQERIVELGEVILEQRDTITRNQDDYSIAEVNEKFARENKGKSWTGEQDHQESIKKLNDARNILDESREKLSDLFDERNDVRVEIKRLDELIDKLDALPKPKADFNIIGITLDNTCKIFIKNNFTSNCPTFELLNSFYPGSPCVTVAYSCISYYNQTGGFHYLIDPPSQVAERIKMIEIRYSFNEFHIQGVGGYDNENHTINYQVGRYLDGCKTAYIGADNWLRYTGDSIYLLLNGCDPAFTYLGGVRSVSINQTVHNIADSYKWQLDKWIKESREKCRELCFEY